MKVRNCFVFFFFAALSFSCRKDRSATYVFWWDESKQQHLAWVTDSIHLYNVNTYLISFPTDIFWTTAPSCAEQNVFKYTVNLDDGDPDPDCFSFIIREEKVLTAEFVYQEVTCVESGQCLAIKL